MTTTNSLSKTKLHKIKNRTELSIAIEQFIDKYRPKEIARYEEDGKVVRVFEEYGNG